MFSGEKREMGVGVVEPHQAESHGRMRVPALVRPDNSNAGPGVLSLLLKGTPGMPERIVREEYREVIKLAGLPQLEYKIPVLKTGESLIVALQVQGHGAAVE